MTKARCFLIILVAVGLLASWPVGTIAMSEQDLKTDAAGRTIEDPSFGVRSVVPTDWQDAGGGIYTRGTPPEDPVLIAIQSAPIGVDGLWSALLPQFALSDIPEAVGDLTTDHFEWTLYAFEVEQPGPVARWPRPVRSWPPANAQRHYRRIVWATQPGSSRLPCRHRRQAHKPLIRA